MFTFDTSLAEFFNAFEVILHYFIDSSGFVVGICVGVLIVKLGIGRIRFIIKVCCLSKVDSIYQLGSLDYSCIASMTKATMPKPSLRVRVEVIRRSASSLHKHCLLFETSSKDKEVLVSARHSQCAPLLLEYY